MPYISREDREYLDKRLKAIVNPKALDIDYFAEMLRDVPSGKVKGAFNYFVSRLWLQTFFPNGEGVGYTSLSDALSVFSDMRQEWYRRLMDEKEDEAIIKNGDLPEYLRIVENNFRSCKNV